MLALHVRYLEAQKHLKVTLKPKLLTSRFVRIKSANKWVILQTDGSTKRVIALNSKARRQRVMLARGGAERYHQSGGRDFSEPSRWSHTTWLLYLRLSSQHWCYIMSHVNRSEHRRSVTPILCTWLWTRRRKFEKQRNVGKVPSVLSVADRNGKILQRRELNVSKT